MRFPWVLGWAMLSATVLLSPIPTPGVAAGSLVAKPVADLETTRSGWGQGEYANLHLGAAGLTLSGDSGFVRDGRAYGIYISEVEPVDAAFDLVRVALAADDVSGGQIELEARSSMDAAQWSAWTPLAPSTEMIQLPPGRFFQYRVELTGRPGESLFLRGLSFELAATGTAPAQSSGQHPTVRLFGTREGLVGRKTANGHTIVERDRFVALPSKRALNPIDKSDYKVRLSYKGRTATVPVWDVGPWNIRDNYWDEKREIFADLPRFVPQALAAWQSNYNGGRDQFNRWVSFPASIDIADGTFIDDLGMRNSDWVEVTFLWVNAPSPSPVEVPLVTRLKPEPKAPVPGLAQSRT